MHRTLNLRTLLFVPATRTEMIPKAFASGADVVIIDWEDAVEIENKTLARQSLVNYEGPPVWVRINAASSSEHEADLKAVAALNCVLGVLLPKTETSADVRRVADTLGKPVIAIIESAKGMVALAQIAHAKGISGLSYGCLDLANDLGIKTHSPAAEIFFNRVRTDLLFHSRANNLMAPIDSVYPDFHDANGLRAYVQQWRDMGFGGMLCIHPNQVAVVHEALPATAEELAFAQKVCQTADETGAAVFHVDGQMVDPPVIATARRLLKQNA